MSYYMERQKALLMVNTLALSGCNVPEIIDKVSLRFGFGRKLVMERLEIMADLGSIELDGDLVKVMK